MEEERRRGGEVETVLGRVIFLPPPRHNDRHLISLLFDEVREDPQIIQDQ